MSISVRLLLAVAVVVFSASSVAEEPGPAQVMLFGVFHFSNPGHDVVKTEQADVMSPANQAYLDELAQRSAPWVVPLGVRNRLERWEFDAVVDAPTVGVTDRAEAQSATYTSLPWRASVMLRSASTGPLPRKPSLRPKAATCSRIFWSRLSSRK